MSPPVVPATSQLEPQAGVLANVSCTEYVYSGGPHAPAVHLRERWSEVVSLPRFREWNAAAAGDGDRYGQWLMGNLLERGAYLLEETEPAAQERDAALFRSMGVLRDRYLALKAEIDAGSTLEEAICEGMNLNPLHGHDVAAAEVQEWVRRCEEHLERVLNSPTSTADSEPRAIPSPTSTADSEQRASPSLASTADSEECDAEWSTQQGEPYLRALLASASAGRQALFISYRTRGIGSKLTYLNHWHCDFDAHDTKRDEHNLGEQKLEDFLMLWLWFVAQSLRRKSEAQARGEAGLEVQLPPDYPPLDACSAEGGAFHGQLPHPGKALTEEFAALRAELTRLLRAHRYDVCNLWFTLDVPRRPRTALVVQSSPVFLDRARDLRLMDEFITEPLDEASSVPTVLSRDLLSSIPGPDLHVCLLFRSSWYSHRSCALRYAEEDKKRDSAAESRGSAVSEDFATTFRRNNMEARFLVLDAGGLRALAEWVVKVQRACERMAAAAGA